MKTMAAIALTICFATPLFAQTQSQPPTSTPATAQPSVPAQHAMVQPPTTTPEQQTTPTTAQPAVPSLANSESGMAVLLLERVLTVLDKAANDKNTDDAVTLDRGLLDQLRAELTQVKVTLQAVKK